MCKLRRQTGIQVPRQSCRNAYTTVAFSESEGFSFKATVAFLYADLFLLLPQIGYLDLAGFLFYATSGFFLLFFSLKFGHNWGYIFILHRPPWLLKPPNRNPVVN
jgi:hypothetical protein